MSSPIVRNFMKQQGFSEEPDSVCDMHFSGLSFQPKILGLLVVIAILLRSPILFFVLSAGLWWNVAFPKWNLFEILYNRVIAAPRGKSMLSPAPPPRIFAQGMAATFVLLAWPRADFGLDDCSLDSRSVFGDRDRGAALWEILPRRVHLPLATREYFLRQFHSPLGSSLNVIYGDLRAFDLKRVGGIAP
jgi:Domain of unknown function (DUF4395)